MTVIEDILKEIDTKNSWGKNELKMMILEKIAKVVDIRQYPSWPTNTEITCGTTNEDK